VGSGEVRGGHKERAKEGEMVEILVLMYENGKMRPVETILRRGGCGIRKNDGRGESN
jgi:hypothetical protein